MELIKNDAKKRLAKISIDSTELSNLFAGIQRASERMERLIELNAPLHIVVRDAEMIQYRALAALSLYEAHILINWAKTDTEPTED
jgi:hypothetical protein